MKVALVYDRVNKWGGAERVLLALHEMFPEAPLYTSVYNPKTAGWAEELEVKTSFLQNLPLARTNHEIYPLLMPVAFESFSFDQYDLVISVTSEAAKGIITKPHTLHICLCLTPTRYLWSGYDDYFPTQPVRALTRPAISYLKKWDRIAATRPDMMLAISHEVKQRIKKYYDRDADILYPPVSLFEDVKAQSSSVDDYYLVVSRLVPYKRIDLAIKACNKLKKSLVIVGAGYELERLQEMAGNTISFVGNLSDEALASYYAGCKAFLFPGREDFGLTMVESLGFGKPVIAFKGGGAEDIVKDQETGIFFDRQTEKSLVNAIEQFESKTFSTQVLKSNARRFGKQQFFTSLRLVLAKHFANLAK